MLGKLKHYLIATKSTVKCLSDHRSLSFLKNGRETGGRIARWALSLAEYDYEIEYIKGVDNQLADLLSRMVKAETLPANRLIQGDRDQTKPHTHFNSFNYPRTRHTLFDPKFF